MTSDPEKAKAFYFRGRDDAEQQEGQEGFPDVWSTYLRTDDARATVRTAAEHGGQVHLEAMDVPEQGSMAMIGDATGAAIGVWQPAGMNGYELAAEPGTAAWHELHTKDYAAAVTFYQDVVGWDTEVMSDTPELRYTTLGSADAATAGSRTPRAIFPPGSRPTGSGHGRPGNRRPGRHAVRPACHAR